jgi:hypothetical protein
MQRGSVLRNWSPSTPPLQATATRVVGAVSFGFSREFSQDFQTISTFGSSPWPGNRPLSWHFSAQNNTTPRIADTYHASGGV